MTLHYTETLDDTTIASMVAEMRVSGQNYHLVATFDDGAVGEVIRIDETVYIRDGTEPWEMESRRSDIPFPLSRDAICPDLTNYTELGQEVLDDGTRVRRFAASTAARAVDGGRVSSAPTTEDWELWIDPTGRLVQATTSSTLLPTEGDPRVRHGQVVEFSGIGEANVITAPVVPTPTPAPGG